MTLTATVKQLKILAAWILFVMFVLFLVAASLGLYVGSRPMTWNECWDQSKEADLLIRALYCNSVANDHYFRKAK